jgi:hypothetical protein
MQAPGRKPNAEKWRRYQQYSHIQHHGNAESSALGSGLARAGGLKPGARSTHGKHGTHSTQLNQAFQVHRQIWSQARTKRHTKAAKDEVRRYLTPALAPPDDVQDEHRCEEEARQQGSIAQIVRYDGG